MRKSFNGRKGQLTLFMELTVKTSVYALIITVEIILVKNKYTRK